MYIFLLMLCGFLFVIALKLFVGSIASSCLSIHHLPQSYMGGTKSLPQYASKVVQNRQAGSPKSKLNFWNVKKKSFTKSSDQKPVFVFDFWSWEACIRTSPSSQRTFFTYS